MYKNESDKRRLYFSFLIMEIFLTNKSYSSFYPHTLTHWFNPFIHRHYRCEGKKMMAG